MQMKCHAGVEFPSGRPCPKCNAQLGEVCWPGINADLLEVVQLREEITRVRAVAWAAQGLLNADTYVSDIPREQAVREATIKLQQALGTWQMHHTASAGIAAPPESGIGQ